MTVLVVGGGITGLAAALELGRAAVPTLLVEASDRLGGKVGTEQVEGFTIEHGPDSMLTTRPAAVALARDVGLGADLIPVNEPRIVHILRDGRPIPIPEGLGLVLPTKLRPFFGTQLFSWPEKARMSLDLVMPRVMSEEDAAVGPYLRRRLGAALVDRLAGPLVGGIYGTAIDELSLDAVVPTLRDAERTHRSLILAGLAEGRRMRAASAARASSATDQATARPLGIFASLAGGLGSLVAATTRSIEATGVVSIALRTRLLDLELAGTGVRGRLSDGRVVLADAAIVATPGPVAAELVGPFAPRAAEAIASIPHASSTVVTLAFPVGGFAEPLVGHGWLVPVSEGLPISALTWSSNKWAGRSPAGAMLVRAFLPGEPVHGRTPDELIAFARDAVRRLTGVTVTPELARVSSWTGVMPRYTVGHLARVDRAERELAAHPAVVLAGASYHGVGLPDCISGARVAARAVLARLGAAEGLPA